MCCIFLGSFWPEYKVDLAVVPCIAVRREMDVIRLPWQRFF